MAKNTEEHASKEGPNEGLNEGLGKLRQRDAPWLDAHLIHANPDHAPKLVPGRAQRAWMDGFVDRHPYRCLPLTMANTTGWELLCPFTVDINWTGGQGMEAISFSTPDPIAAHELGPAQILGSHFMAGIVTFHTGRLFRTPPGWAVLCMGPPNWPKDGIYPLSGLIETDWLPFPFTMNWQMTRPGRVRFEAGEPFCFITLVEHHRLEGVAPHQAPLAEDPALKADFDAWRDSRAGFMDKLARRDENAVKQGWQRHYMRGTKADGDPAKADHVTKRRLLPPIWTGKQG